MSFTTIAISFCLGSILTSAYWKYFRKNEEVNTDVCMDYLRQKGYFVNLNMVQNKGK